MFRIFCQSAGWVWERSWDGWRMFFRGDLSQIPTRVGIDSAHYRAVNAPECVSARESVGLLPRKYTDGQAGRKVCAHLEKMECSICRYGQSCFWPEVSKPVTSKGD